MKRYAPSGVGTTGTTGVIFTTKDMVLWDDRIRKDGRNAYLCTMSS